MTDHIPEFIEAEDLDEAIEELDKHISIMEVEDE